MLPTLSLATLVYIAVVLAAPPVDIDGIREPVSGSLLYGNNLISCAGIPSSNAIGVHFYPVWESLDYIDWFYNGGSYQFIVLHFLLGTTSYLGREWEFSFRLGMRPWIFIAYTSPLAAAFAIFLVYPIGQGSFSDGPAGNFGYIQFHASVPSRTPNSLTPFAYAGCSGSIRCFSILCNAWISSHLHLNRRDNI